MATNDDEEEVAGVVAGVVGGIALCVVAVLFANGGFAKYPTATVAEIKPVGEALAKVYFGVDEARLTNDDMGVVSMTMAALAVNAKAIVLLSGFHDPSGDPKHNAELATARAHAVRDALVAGGVSAIRVKFRKPESTVGSGSPEEGRRVEIRVQ
jgi:outer membrane protein OmpA-like peptidoglycan-associated protein